MQKHHIPITETSKAEKIHPQRSDLNAVDADEPIEATESEVYRQIKAEMTNTPDERLKLNRLRTGMTQAQLAKKCAIRKEHLSLMEQGKRPIGLSIAKKLASALGVDHQAFL